ncbi:hypothetical protein BG011_003927 [Mortierella polycephala]|uniref:Uncharacterized protein n=1 Tax=Mortierella polycephala TaxID=41804 RepID=A0A9P6PZS3_9FUNG|nr:hypothetical protein BG011_003927 [Mortierella polycephala]
MAPPPRTQRQRMQGKKLPAGAGATAAAAAAARRNKTVEMAPHVLDPKTTSEESATVDVDQETTAAKGWIKENVDQEVTRIRSTGTNIESLAVKNFGIVVDVSRKKPSAINRIEVDTNFDFKKVQQIMVSPGIPYPHKENFEYVNVLLFTENTEAPMLVPYLYDTKFKTQEPINEDKITSTESTGSTGSTGGNSGANQRPWIHVKNSLTDWLLVNSQHMRARHHIDEFHDI